MRIGPNGGGESSDDSNSSTNDSSSDSGDSSGSGDSVTSRVARGTRRAVETARDYVTGGSSDDTSSDSGSSGSDGSSSPSPTEDRNSPRRRAYEQDPGRDVDTSEPSSEQADQDAVDAVRRDRSSRSPSPTDEPDTSREADREAVEAAKRERRSRSGSSSPSPTRDAGQNRSVPTGGSDSSGRDGSPTSSPSPTRDTGGSSRGWWGGVVNYATDTANRVQEGVAAAGDVAAGNADEAVGRATGAAGRGDWDATAEALTPAGAEQFAWDVGTGTINAFGAAYEGDWGRAGDIALGSSDEYWAGVNETYAPAFDVLAGDTDESFARMLDSLKRGDIGGVGDAVAGDADEATARFLDAAQRRDLGGMGDAAAGRTDEAAAGVIDEAGGLGESFLEGTGDYAEGSADEASRRVAEATEEAATGDLAGAADALAGQHDESIGAISDALTEQLGEQWSESSEALQDPTANPEATVRAVSPAFWFDYDTTATVADELAGSTDESVGGGFSKTTSDALTTEGGFLTEGQEADLARASESFSGGVEDYQRLVGDVYGAPGDAVQAGLEGAGVDTDVSANVAGVQFDLFRDGAAPGERFIEGAAGIVGFGNVFGAVGAAETGTEIAANTGDEVAAGGAAAVGSTATAFGTKAGQEMIESATKNPFETTGEFASEVLFGLGAGRAVEMAADASRSARVSARADETFDIGDVSTDDAAQGNLPEFDTPGNAPTEKAVGEVRQKADDSTPAAVRESLGDNPALYHGAGDGKFGAEIDVMEGGSELPGLWVSPQVSPLRLSTESTTVGLPGLRPRLPRIRGGGDQIVAAQGDRIDAMPDWANEYGYAVRSESGDVVESGLSRAQANRFVEQRGGERVPDPGTSGYEYLTEQADPGTAYVRPPGSRNQGELEAVYPPGSRFVETDETFAVNYDGRTVELQPYQRLDQTQIEEATGKTGEEAVETFEQQTGRTVTSSAPTSYVDDRAGAPFAPPPGVMPSGPTASSGAVDASAEMYLNEGLPTTSEMDVSGPAPSGPSSPTSGTGDLGPEWSSGGTIDEFGTSDVYAAPDPYEPSGGTGSPSPGGSSSSSDDYLYGPGPSSGGSSGGSSPGSSGGSGGPSSGGGPSGGPPTYGPPSYGPPGDGYNYPTGSGGGGEWPPGPPTGGGGGYGFGFGDPTFGGSRQEWDPRDGKDDEEFRRPSVTPFNLGYTNPIASSSEVLFGALGASGISPGAGTSPEGLSAAEEAMANPLFGGDQEVAEMAGRLDELGGL